MKSKEFIEAPLHRVYAKNDYDTMTAARQGAYDALGFADTSDTPQDIKDKWDHR